MNEYDNMDIDDLVNNPFKNIDLENVEGAGGTSVPRRRETSPPPAGEPTVRSIARTARDHTDENTAQADRILNLEKNMLATDKNVDTLTEIIEEQNERIRKLEEELAILRDRLASS